MKFLPRGRDRWQIDWNTRRVPVLECFAEPRSCKDQIGHIIILDEFIREGEWI